MESTHSHGGELFLVLEPLLVRSAAEEGGGADVSFPVGHACITNLMEVGVA